MSPQQQRHHHAKGETPKEDDIAASDDSNKKAKLEDRQACRLIQPGGSGASFLSLQQQQITPETVEALLKPTQENNGSDQPTHTAEELCLALQCSLPEIEHALESLPCAKLHNNGSSSSDRFRLWTDEEHWNAKRALVEMLCEEECDSEDEDLAPEQFVKQVAQRIVLPDENASQDDDGAAHEWKFAMFRLQQFRQFIVAGPSSKRGFIYCCHKRRRAAI